MIVNVAHGETFEAVSKEVDLREVIPDPSEFAEAHAELARNGRYWVGGGAAPLFYITKAETAR